MPRAAPMANSPTAAVLRFPTVKVIACRITFPTVDVCPAESEMSSAERQEQSGAGCTFVHARQGGSTLLRLYSAPSSRPQQDHTLLCRYCCRFARHAHHHGSSPSPHWLWYGHIRHPLACRGSHRPERRLRASPTVLFWGGQRVIYALVSVTSHLARILQVTMFVRPLLRATRAGRSSARRFASTAPASASSGFAFRAALAVAGAAVVVSRHDKLQLTAGRHSLRLPPARPRRCHPGYQGRRADHHPRRAGEALAGWVAVGRHRRQGV